MDQKLSSVNVELPQLRPPCGHYQCHGDVLRLLIREGGAVATAVTPAATGTAAMGAIAVGSTAGGAAAMGAIAVGSTAGGAAVTAVADDTEATASLTDEELDELLGITPG